MVSRKSSTGRCISRLVLFCASGLWLWGIFPWIKTCAGQEGSVANSAAVSNLEIGPEQPTLNIRRLYVPEDRLVEFMRDRPAFLPLSSAKFAEIVAAAQKKQVPEWKAEPLRHWLTILPGGRLQGFSLLRTRPWQDGRPTADDFTKGWLSFDDWKISAECFNLVPKTTAAFDFTDLNASWGFVAGSGSTGEYNEVPVVLSVNEQGSYGMPLSQAEPFMLLRYNLTLATHADSHALRQIQLPNKPSTITFLKDRTNNPFQFLINGWLQPMSRPATPGEANSTEEFVYRQAICDSPNLIGQFVGVDPVVQSLPMHGRYVEHSTLMLNRATTRYETVVSLDLREAVQGDLNLEIPDGMELVTCEVNGASQSFKLAATGKNSMSLKLPWQVWKISNRIRLVGTLPPVLDGRIVVPRVSLPGHTWTVGNIQVRIEAPLSLRNYELIDSRVIRCQELGETQSLSFQWGSPEAQIALLLDKSSANSLAARSSPPDVVLVTANQESLEAEQYLLPDLRFSDSNVMAFEVGSQWQVEQIAWFDPRPTGANPTDRIAESNLTPLPWLLNIRGDRQVVLVTLPNEVGKIPLGLRVRALRPVTQWPVDIDCRVLKATSDSSLPQPTAESPAVATRPCLVSLRGTAGIRADSVGPLRWSVLTNDEARQQAAELASTLGAGNFQFSRDPSVLTLHNNAALTGSYEALAYTRNHVQESSVVRQVHRLLIQPSGPVYEIEIASSRPPLIAGQWQVYDAKNQAVPFEITPAAEENRWRLRFNQPLSGATSILIEQQWQADATGSLLLYSAPKARTFAGVVDTQTMGTQVFRVRASTGLSDERLAASLRAFRDNSRSWLLERDERNPAGTLVSPSAEPQPSHPPTKSIVTLPETSCVFSNPNDVEYARSQEGLDWNSVVVSQATQVDTWRHEGWSTRLTLNAYCENSGLVVLDLPTNAQVQQVRVNDHVIPIDYESPRLRIPLSGTGVQSIQCLWQVPHESSFRMGTGLTSLPARNAVLELTEESDRLVCLPNDFSLVSAPDEPMSLSYSLGRRVISPLIWPESWPISREATSVVPSGWSRFQSTGETPSNHFCWWRQESIPAPSDRELSTVLVSDRRVFAAEHWAVLLLGCLGLLVARVVKRRLLPSQSLAAPWWIGGICVAAALCVPWPYYSVASTMLLGLMLGCSWSNIWQLLCDKSGEQTTPAVAPGHDTKSTSTIRTASSTLLIWAIGLGLCFSQMSGHDSLAATWGADEISLLPSQDRLPQESNTPATNSSLTEEYQLVVIPIDADQKPTEKVVYLSPELYRTLTEQTQATATASDLGVHHAQHTLEYDSQLDRFFRLTTQYTCRTQSKRTYLLPSTATGEHVIRQLRVNGVPVLFQRRNDQIAVPLESGTNILSIAYDLQSTKTGLELATLGTSESYVVLNGIPNGLQVVAIDQDNPMQRFRSSIQRRFRIDRIKRLLVDVNRQSTEAAPASLETWLSIQPQQIQCELRMTVGPALKYRSEWLFQVDPRLVLPTGFQSNSNTWSFDRLPDGQRPANARSGPVYRLLFSKDHRPDKTITIPWEYRDRSFGLVIPPQIEILQPVDTPVRNWLVLGVADGLVYRPAELALINYRRANLIELENARAKKNLKESEAETITPPAEAEFADKLQPIKSKSFVYEVMTAASAVTQPNLGKLSLQPTQVSGTVRQDVLLSENSANMTVAGELKVQHGELSQLPIRLPLGTKIQSLIIMTAQQNEVAWTIRQGQEQADEVIVLLRSPLSGTLKFDMTADVPLAAQGSIRFPWARFLAPLEVNQTLQVQDFGSTWQLRTSGGQFSRLQTPQTFVVATDSADGIDQLAIVRFPRSLATPDSSAVGTPSPSLTQSSNENRNGSGETASQNEMPRPPSVEVLAGRLVLVPSNLKPHSKGADPGTCGRIEGLLQVLVRNHRHSSVGVRVPAGASILRGWVDRKPAMGMLASSLNTQPAVEKNRETGASNLERENLGGDSQTGGTIHLSLDPLEDFSLITLQVLWQAESDQLTFSLPEIEAEGQVPVHVSGLRGATCPEDLLQHSTSVPPPSNINVQEVLAQKTADWTSADVQQGWPTEHPLRWLAEEPWPNEGQWLPAGTSMSIKVVPELDLPVDAAPAGSFWQWFWVVSALAAVWGLGVFWPRLVPRPAVWGDFGWLIVAGGVWLGGGQVWLFVLLLLMGLSFLACRVLRWRFSWRFA